MRLRQKDKVALITWMVVYPLITTIIGTLGPWIESWPLVLRTFFLSFLMVFFMVYFIMPLVMKRLATWIES